MRSYSHRAWPVFAGICVQAGYGLEVEGLDHMLRKKRPPYIKGGLHNRAKEIVLSISVRDLKSLIDRMVFSTRELEYNHFCALRPS